MFVQEGRGSLKIEQKLTGGGRGEREVLACLYIRGFLKKMLRFSKWSFIVILQFFLLITIAV